MTQAPSAIGSFFAFFMTRTLGCLRARMPSIRPSHTAKPPIPAPWTNEPQKSVENCSFYDVWCHGLFHGKDIRKDAAQTVVMLSVSPSVAWFWIWSEGTRIREDGATGRVTSWPTHGKQTWVELLFKLPIWVFTNINVGGKAQMFIASKHGEIWNAFRFIKTFLFASGVLWLNSRVSLLLPPVTGHGAVLWRHPLLQGRCQLWGEDGIQQMIQSLFLCLKVESLTATVVSLHVSKAKAMRWLQFRRKFLRTNVTSHSQTLQKDANGWFVCWLRGIWSLNLQISSFRFCFRLLAWITPSVVMNGVTLATVRSAWTPTILSMSRRIAFGCERLGSLRGTVLWTFDTFT